MPDDLLQGDLLQGDLLQGDKAKTHKVAPPSSRWHWRTPVA
ncbi:MAG: hypothetical protein ACI8UD_000108, partial [Planctomycetota bacterium]